MWDINKIAPPRGKSRLEIEGGGVLVIPTQCSESVGKGGHPRHQGEWRSWWCAEKKGDGTLEPHPDRQIKGHINKSDRIKAYTKGGGSWERFRQSRGVRYCPGKSGKLWKKRGSGSPLVTLARHGSKRISRKMWGQRGALVKLCKY